MSSMPDAIDFSRVHEVILKHARTEPFAIDLVVALPKLHLREEFWRQAPRPQVYLAHTLNHLADRSEYPSQASQVGKEVEMLKTFAAEFEVDMSIEKCLQTPPAKHDTFAPQALRDAARALAKRPRPNDACPSPFQDPALQRAIIGKVTRSDSFDVVADNGPQIRPKSPRQRRGFTDAEDKAIVEGVAKYSGANRFQLIFRANPTVWQDGRTVLHIREHWRQALRKKVLE
jgi:hypothetical protein